MRAMIPEPTWITAGVSDIESAGTYIPGDLYKVLETLLCDELEPNKLMAGSIVMILNLNEFNSSSTNVLFGDVVIGFDNTALRMYTVKMKSHEE